MLHEQEAQAAIGTGVPAPGVAHPRLMPGALGPWLREGARAALFLRPRWQGLQAHPAVLLALVIAGALLALTAQRLYIDGPARFYPWAFFGGWLFTAALAWVAYLMRPPIAGDVPDGVAPGAVHLFCLLCAQSLFLTALWSALFVVLQHSGAYAELDTGRWVLTLLSWGWLLLSQWALLLGQGARRRGAVAAAMLVLLVATVGSAVLQPMRFWYPLPVPSASPSSPEPAMLKLDQALMEGQPRLLASQLQALQPQRRGVVDLYGITFAPYADVDVFRRESALVDSAMRQRFDAEGRTLQLVNHAATGHELPWATPLNLQRAIRRMAEVMDRDEDVLFIHLTSHGGRDAHLAASFFPLEVDELTPQQLKAWLDEAGIRNRVISISACFSGSWIAPLADEHTLVMTAADADHTSYGCGSRSELTFFGRAMYDEELRSRTLSFEQAHAAVRPVIERREQEAGKTDGYSNPQISVGAGIREPLRRLQARLLQSGSS